MLISLRHLQGTCASEGEGLCVSTTPASLSPNCVVTITKISDFCGKRNIIFKKLWLQRLKINP